MKTSERLDNLAGQLCKAVIPVRREYFVGKGKEVGICTLSSLDLLERISRMDDVLNKVAIAGRLLSENKGIDAIIKFVMEHPDLTRIVVCGRDSKGHRAGQALLSLSENGIDDGGKIIDALGPYPILKSGPRQIEEFRNRVKLVDMIGVAAIEKIVALVP
jgi:tetrahydromethanopterin S-methyltransferase subunit A